MLTHTENLLDLELPQKPISRCVSIGRCQRGRTGEENAPLLWAALSNGLLSQGNEKEKVDQAPAILFASWWQMHCDSHFRPMPPQCHEPWLSDYKLKQTFSSSSASLATTTSNCTCSYDNLKLPFYYFYVFLWGLRCFWGCAAKAGGKGGHPRWKGEKERYPDPPWFAALNSICEGVTATGKWSDLAGMRPT